MATSETLLTSLLVIDLVILAVFYIVLLRSLPRSLQREMRRNYVRHGRCNLNRRAVEKLNLAWYAAGMSGVAAVPLLLGSLGLAWFNARVIPLPLAARAVASYDGDTHRWKENLAPVDIDYQQWTRDRGIADGDATRHVLFDHGGWIAVGGTLYVLLTIAGLGRINVEALTQLQAGIQKRHREYQQEDMALEQRQDHRHQAPTKTHPTGQA